MKKSPLKLIKLSLLLFAGVGAISCNNDNDLIAEYVLSDTTNSKILQNPLAKINAPRGLPEASQTTQAALASKGTVEIDHMTNTLIYTPAQIILNVVASPSK